LSKDSFAHRRPIGVALEQLFNRGGLIAKDAVTTTWVHRAKNLFHGGKQNAADSVQTGGGTLCSADKVVNTIIDGCELAMMGVVQVGVTKQGRGWATEEAEESDPQ
jgi:hypothetical protein